MEENVEIQITNNDEGLEQLKISEEDINEEKLDKLDKEEDKVLIRVKMQQEFSYVDYHADCKVRMLSNDIISEYAFIDSIKIKNHTDIDYTDLTLIIDFAYNAIEDTKIEIEKLNASQEISLRIPFLKVERDAIDNLTEVYTDQVIFSLVLNNTEQMLSRIVKNFDILPISLPSKKILEHPSLYAKFVTPNDHYVKNLTVEARSKRGQKPFIAYQNSTYDQKIEEIKDLYTFVHDLGIAYQNPPASFTVQRLRMPYEVIKYKKGTCLDLSILLCSLLEEIGYNPILIFIYGHALVGVHLDDTALDKAFSTSKASIINHIGKTSDQILVLESTCLDAGNNSSFKEVINAGVTKLLNYDGAYFYALDIMKCHTGVFDKGNAKNLKSSGIFSPIPTVGNDDNLTALLNPLVLEYEKLDPVVKTKYVDVVKKGEKNRFTFWEKKLLDLTESNPLVVYKKSINKTILLPTLFKQITNVQNKNSFKTRFLDLGDKDMAVVFDNPELNTSILEANDGINTFTMLGYDKTLRSLIKKSNMSVEETGSPTLYLCLGELSFVRKNRLRGKAPFLVLPVRVSKDKMSLTYTVTYDYDDLMVNDTFFEYYKQENEEFRDVEYQFDLSLNYVDICNWFKKNVKADIILREDCIYLCNLTFAHYIMWQDLLKRKEFIAQNEVVKSFLLNKSVLSEEQKEQVIDYKEFAAPLNFDSSQLKAIMKCGNGESFILDGPPGTGKSQTIVNMIVNAFYHGKTVLFVAAKKAALDVVYNRLEKIKLDRFCLQLHSSKANKTDFFQKLKNSMELGQTLSPQNYEETISKLQTTKCEIEQIFDKMHNKKYLPYSLYECIIGHLDIEDQNLSYQLVNVDPFLLKKLTIKNINDHLSALNEYTTIAKTIKNFEHTYLKVIGLNNLNYNDEALFREDFDRLNATYYDFKNAYTRLLEYIDLMLPLNKDIVINSIDSLDIILNNDLFIDQLENYVSLKDEKLILDTLDECIKASANYSVLEPLFDMQKVLELDVFNYIQALETNTNYFKKIFLSINAKKALKQVLYKGKRIKNNDLLHYLKNINAYQEHYKFIKDHANVLYNYSKINLLDQYLDGKNILTKFKNTKTLVDKLIILSNFDTLANLIAIAKRVKASLDISIKHQFDEMMMLFNTFKDVEFEICKKYIFDLSIFEKLECYEVNDYEEFLDEVSLDSSFNELIKIISLNKIYSYFKGEGIEEFIYNVLINKCKVEELIPCYNDSLYMGMIKIYYCDEDVNYFNSSKASELINEYKRLINKYNGLVIEEVTATLASKLNHNTFDYKSSSPIGRLKKAVQSLGRGVTIRNTLLEYDNLIKAYFPCFLMSPLSAAQYLSVDNDEIKKFDLVIFDEASQIPTHEAVGAIARGNSLIIAGDPEQMPPSNYFNSTFEYEEDEVEFEDAPSLLDECISVCLPRIRLNYHYRSRHESLIKFSNKHFYNDSLFTFPSPNSLKKCIDFKYVELEENKKNSDLSKKELEIILNTFKYIYNNEATMNKSVGIIVFNMKQQEIVYDAINKLITEDDTLATKLDNVYKETQEEWFVKSLENVQGDERDIIILSIGFRKTNGGRPDVKGPLALKNGERRLNVAVSRSKEKMIVISTIKYSDFDNNEKITNRGSRLLKNFLNYVESIQNSEVKVKNEAKTLAKYLKKDLEKRGLVCDLNVGNSSFIIDCAIKDVNTNEYTLGILIDSSGLSDSITCRDKIFVQDNVLNNLKWRIIHVYTLDYYRNKEEVIKKIIESLNIPYQKEVNNLDINIVQALKQEHSFRCTDYVEYNCEKDYVFYYSSTGFTENIIKHLIKIIDLEAPISFELIKKRLKGMSNITKFTANMEFYLKKFLRSITDNVTKEYDDKNREIVFYWGYYQNHHIDSFRKGKRDIYEIPKEEILCAIKQIIDVQIELSEDDLFKATLEAFEYGNATLNQKNRHRLKTILDNAKE